MRSGNLAAFPSEQPSSRGCGELASLRRKPPAAVQTLGLPRRRGRAAARSLPVGS